MSDIVEARRISPYLRHTPMVQSYTLSQLLGANVHLKMEVFQRTGSFKPRGAFNQILRLSAGQRRRGVVAGLLVALKALRPEVRIWGVETEGAEGMAQALQAGRVVEIKPTSLARTLGTPYVSAEALALVQAR